MTETDQRLWANAAAAVTILLRDKTPLNQAVSEIAHRVGVDPTALAEFRKNVGKAHAPATAREHYQLMLTTAMKCQLPAAKVVDLLLEPNLATQRRR